MDLPDFGIPPQLASRMSMAEQHEYLRTRLMRRRTLVTAGLPEERVVASGFGAHHPRAAGRTAEARRQNRRIEVLVVPLQAVSSR